jgi:hypothetical protein
MIRAWLYWLWREHRWPGPAQRDFMSSDPARRARVRALAEQINSEIYLTNDAEGGASGCRYGINDECRCAEGGTAVGGF